MRLFSASLIGELGVMEVDPIEKKQHVQGTEAVDMGPEEIEAAQANQRMEDVFYGDQDEESAAEAVDAAVIFRNQS